MHYANDMNIVCSLFLFQHWILLFLIHRCENGCGSKEIGIYGDRDGQKHESSVLAHPLSAGGEFWLESWGHSLALSLGCPVTKINW